MGTDTSDPIGGHRPPPAPPKKKTISGPVQSYQIVVSVSTLTELQTMQPPGVDGAPTFFRDNGLPWFWFRNLPAGYTASTDGHTGATASTKAGFYVSLFALVAATALGSFLTVQRASSSRMLDVPASTLYLVKDGARTYVQSFVSGWHWQSNFPAATATDNEVTCRPIAWAALGLPGAFVRDLQGDRTARSQTSWTVNLTAPDNEGTGSPTDPVKNDLEIVRRWGQGTVIFSQPTTITYVQSPTTTTNFDVGYSDGGSLTIKSTYTITQPAVTITAVQVQVRTPGAEAPWAITGATFSAGDVGNYAVILQSSNAANIGAYAKFLKDETGGKLRVNPFTSWTGGGAGTQITPLVGDVVQVCTPATTLKVGFIRVLGNTQLVPTTTLPIQNAVVFDTITIDGQVGTGAGINGGFVRGDGAAVLYVRTQMNNMTITAACTTFSKLHAYIGTGFGGTSNAINGFDHVFNRIAVLNSTLATAGPGFFQLQADCYFQNGVFNVNQGGCVATAGIGCFDCASADRAFTLGVSVNGGGAYVRQVQGVADWGTGNAGHGLTVRATSNYVYTTKPTINSGLGAGREALIGGTDKLYTAVPFIEPTNNAALVLAA